MLEMCSAHMEYGIGFQWKDGHHLAIIFKKLSCLIEEGIQMVLSITRYAALEG